MSIGARAFLLPTEDKTVVERRDEGEEDKEGERHGRQCKLIISLFQEKREMSELKKRRKGDEEEQKKEKELGRR